MGEKYSMTDDYILDNILDKIKEIIGTENFDNTGIFTEANDKLLPDVTFKNVLGLIKCVIKNDDKLYSQIFLEEAVFIK